MYPNSNGYGAQGYGYGQQMGYGYGYGSQSNMMYPGSNGYGSVNSNPMGGAVPSSTSNPMMGAIPTSNSCMQQQAPLSQSHFQSNFVSQFVGASQVINSQMPPSSGYGGIQPYSKAVPMNCGNLQQQPQQVQQVQPQVQQQQQQQVQQQPQFSQGYVQQPQVQPTREFINYHIPEGQEGRYGNLYSLISTIEVLEDEYCNGNINSEEHNRLFRELQTQFNTVQNALNLTAEDIKLFCSSCKLSSGYAISALFNNIPNDISSGSISSNISIDPQQAVALGTDFTTLSDYCMVDVVTAGQYLTLIRQIRGRLQSMGILKRNEEVRNLTENWINNFEHLKPNDKVPSEIIEQLKSQIGVWRTSAIDSMR